MNTKTGISDRITSTLDTQRRENIENLESITYQGKTIPLKSQRLKTLLEKVNQIEAQEDSPSKHSDIIKTVEECIVVINKEKTEEAKKSEGSGALFNVLLQYVNKIKLTAILDRSLDKAFTLAHEIPIEVVFGRTKLKA